MSIENEKTYDSVFWSSVSNMPGYFIPLVNEAFGEHFTDKAEVTLRPMKQVTRLPGAQLKRGEVDSLATLSERTVTKDYHIEMEAWGNGGLAIRIAEYAAGYAYASVVKTEHGAKMTIPFSAVIFLRSKGTPPDKLLIEIDFPGGKVSYEAPVLNMKDYSVSELFEKRLLLLVPFHGFTFADDFDRMNEQGAGELLASLDEINDRLIGMVQSGEIVESQKSHMIEWTQKVLERMTVKYENISKEVGKAMGGYMIRTRTDEILDEGRAEGERNGIEKGRAEGIDLMNYLWSHGRGEEAQKASSDKDLFNKLLAEFKKTVTSAAVL